MSERIFQVVDLIIVQDAYMDLRSCFKRRPTGTTFVIGEVDITYIAPFEVLSDDALRNQMLYDLFHSRLLDESVISDAWTTTMCMPKDGGKYVCLIHEDDGDEIKTMMLQQ